MHSSHKASWLAWLASAFLFPLWRGVLGAANNNTTITEEFPQYYSSTDLRLGQKPSLGRQNFTHCCLLAVDQWFVAGGKNTTNIRITSDDLATFGTRQFPCGATYSGSNAGAPKVNIAYTWCKANCGGWQLSKNSKLNQWVSPLVGFLVPAVVFCLAIPRRRKLHIPDKLFDVPLNKITSNFRTPLIALCAAALVTVDTITWLMAIFALSGPILVGGIYEAFLDSRILSFVQDKIKYSRLTIADRAHLLYSILVGNLDMLTVPEGDAEEHTAWAHVDTFLVLQLRSQLVDDHYVQETKTRLRTMLSAQYSFGVTVGAPVIFFCGSFIYTLVDNFSNLGDNDTSHALAFGMWWMTIPHIAIISGLLLAGNNPNTLEGIVGEHTCLPQSHKFHLFALVYESRYRPAWIWNRGRSKKIWVERLSQGNDIAQENLTDEIRMQLGDWMVVAICGYTLILLPSILAFLTSFYTPEVGLSCRSMTFLTYMLSQLWLIALWVWDIETTHIDNKGCPHSPATHWGNWRDTWQAHIWYPLVLVGGTVAVFTAIGGTLMQIMGVYRTCLCDIPIGKWLRPGSDSDLYWNAGTNSAENIQLAQTWWRGTGAGAISFLGFICYVGWWYQRRLRYQFRVLIEKIDTNVPP